MVASNDRSARKQAEVVVQELREDWQQVRALLTTVDSVEADIFKSALISPLLTTEKPVLPLPYTHTHTHIYVYTYIHTYIHVYIGRICPSVAIYIHTYIHTYLHTYTYIRIRMYVCMYVCMHVYTHTHTHLYIRRRLARREFVDAARAPPAIMRYPWSFTLLRDRWRSLRG
jgi:hypothetical protein